MIWVIATTTSSWGASPVPLTEPQTGLPPVRTYLSALERRLAGPGAPTSHRRALNYAEVQWTLARSQAGEDVVYNEGRRDQAIRAVAQAAGLAAEDMMQTSLVDLNSDWLLAVRSPTLTVSGRKGRGMRATTGQPTTERLAHQAYEDFDVIGGGGRQSLRVGSHLRVVDLLDPPEDIAHPVDVSAFFAARRLGLSAWRVSGLLLTRQLAFSGRQDLGKRLALTATMRTRTIGEKNPQVKPRTWSAGTATPLGGRWQLLTRYRTTFRRGNEDRGPVTERLGLVEVRAILGWRALKY